MATIPTTATHTAIGTRADILKIELRMQIRAEEVHTPQAEQQIQEFTQEAAEVAILRIQEDHQMLNMPVQVAHTVAMV